MKKKTSGRAAAFLAAAAVCTAAMPFHANADSGMKIVALGDSITNGYSVDGSLIASYPELISSYYGAELVNYAQDGLTSAGLLAQLSDGAVQSDIASADVVLITIGGNDVLGPFLNNEYIDATKYNSLSALIAGVKEQGDIAALKLQLYLNSTMPDAIKNCNANVQQIAGQICGMTDAAVVIQTVYNPMDLDGDDTTHVQSGSVTALCANVNNYLEGKPDNTLYPEDGGINDIIRGLGGVSVVDTFYTFENHSYFYTHIDNADVHPNSKGHLAIAETIIECLNIPETGNENGTLFRRAYTFSGAEQTLAGVNASINKAVLARAMMNYAYGDVDASGVIDILDAAAALGIYASQSAGVTPEITGINAEAADGNRDGKTNITDAALMLGYYSEKATGLFDGSFMEYISAKTAN